MVGPFVVGGGAGALAHPLSDASAERFGLPFGVGLRFGVGVTLPGYNVSVKGCGFVGHCLGPFSVFRPSLKGNLMPVRNNVNSFNSCIDKKVLRSYVANMDTTIKPEGRLYGYARVSTEDQDLQLQLNALRDAGVPSEWIFSEKRSGGRMDRPELRRLLRSARSGDTLIVWKLDRLGRSVKGILDLVDELDREGIALRILTEAVDTSTPTGRMVMTILASLAQMERDLTSERTKAGIAAKREAGHQFGRRHSILDYPERVEAIRPYIENGTALTMRAQDAVEIINRAGPRKVPPIKSPETFRRWRRDGFPGVPKEGQG